MLEIRRKYCVGVLILKATDNISLGVVGIAEFPAAAGHRCQTSVDGVGERLSCENQVGYPPEEESEKEQAFHTGA